MAGHELPEPPIPPYLDLRKIAYMPLEARTLRDSRLAAECDGETFKAAVLLWCASWHQVPAGSLPNNERELTLLCGLGKNIQKFRAISGLMPANVVVDPSQGYDTPPRQVSPKWGGVSGGVYGGVMTGWVLCRDGRYYHSIICQLAVNAWNNQAKRNYQLGLDRLRKTNKERIERGEEPVKLTPPETVFYGWEITLVSGGIPADFGEAGDKRFRRNSGASISSSRVSKNQKHKTITDGENPPSVSGGTAEPGQQPGVLVVSSTPAAKAEAISPGRTVPRPPPKSVVQQEVESLEAKRQALTNETWRAYADAYFARYKQEPLRNAMVNGMIARFVQRVGRDSAPFVAAFYVTLNNGYYVEKMHTVGPMVKDAEALYAQWINRSRGESPMTRAKARQIDQQQATNDAFSNVLAQVEGGGKSADDDHDNGLGTLFKT